MKVKDYMHTPSITVKPDDLLSVARQRLFTHRIRHLPVVDDANHLVGVLTDRDIRQVGPSDEPHIAEYELTYLLDKATVKEVMTKDVVTVDGETPIAEAARIFLEKKFSGLPVVRADNTLEGIITVTDLIRAYVERHQATPSAP